MDKQTDQKVENIPKPVPWISDQSSCSWLCIAQFHPSARNLHGLELGAVHFELDKLVIVVKS